MAAARSTAALVQVTRAARMMATDIHIQLAVTPEEEVRAARAADACMGWLAEVDACLSRFRSESELCRLNASGGSWFAASSLLYDAVACAVRAAEASDGLFDPTLLPLLEAAGYDRDFSLIAHSETLLDVSSGLRAADVAAQWATRWQDVALDPASRRIRLPRDVRLDLGGIAKGWAADVALERFCEPFANALVNVGGDLRLRGGPAEGEAWSVGLRNPRREPLDGGVVPPDGYAAVISMSRGGLATSGAVRRWWLRGGERRHHLLDPRTGQPIPLWLDERDDTDLAHGADAPPRIATATALATTAARAEVAAKVALLRDYPAALRAVEDAWARDGAVGPESDCDAGLALALVLGDGTVALSGNVGEYLASVGTAGAPLPAVIHR